jgi:hypothetical protein
MATRKRTAAQRAYDLTFIERLHLRGHTEQEIADKLSKERPYDLTRQQISYDLRKLLKMWLKEAQAEVEEEKARALAELRTLQHEYWELYEASKEPFRKVITKGRGKGDSKQPAHLEKTTAVEERLGDPRYLAGVQWCIEQRLKIFGVYAAVKVDHSGGISVKGYVDISPDDWDEDNASDDA